MKLSSYELLVLKTLYHKNNSSSISDVLMSNGFYPEEQIEAMQNILDNKIVLKENENFIVSDEGKEFIKNFLFFKYSKLDQDKLKDQLEKLIKDMPQEHLLEYQWWFTSDTCSAITKIICDISRKSNPYIGFLGCPTLGLYFNQAFPEINISIIDISSTILDYLSSHTSSACNIINFDIRNYKNNEKVLNSKLDLIVMDPPFYSDYYKLFVEFAASMQDNNADLLTALCNPNIKSDYRELHKIFSEFSKKYTLISFKENFIYYRVPHYESETYKNLGFSDQQLSSWCDWRNNNLLHFKRFIDSDSKLILNREDDWNKYCIGKIRIFVKKPTLNAKSGLYPEIIPFYEDGTETVKSLSRRYDKRTEISLWTSENKVYTIKDENLKIVNYIIENIQKNQLNEKEICKEFALIKPEVIKNLCNKIHNLFYTR